MKKPKLRKQPNKLLQAYRKNISQEYVPVTDNLSTEKVLRKKLRKQSKVFNLPKSNYVVTNINDLMDKVGLAGGTLYLASDKKLYLIKEVTYEKTI